MVSNYGKLSAKFLSGTLREEGRTSALFQFLARATIKIRLRLRNQHFHSTVAMLMYLEAVSLLLETNMHMRLWARCKHKDTGKTDNFKLNFNDYKEEIKQTNKQIDATSCRKYFYPFSD